MRENESEQSGAQNALQDICQNAEQSVHQVKSVKKRGVRKKLWAVAVLLCVVAAVTGTYLTYTAYRAGDFLKAVAATGTSQALFTSDLLNEYADARATVTTRSIIVDSTGDTCSFTFRIYNCLLDNKNVFNSKDVNAHLTVSAENAGDSWLVREGSTEIKGDVTSADGYAMAFPGYTATIKTFTVVFDKKYLDQAKFTITALVDTASSPGTNLAKLASIIIPNRRADVTNASVTGAWVDKNGNNVDAFDAYNYRVTVTGKTAQVELTWGEGVELDPFFAKNHTLGSGEALVDTANRTARFDMDPGSQVINFFRADGSNAPASWEDIGVSVEAV